MSILHAAQRAESYVKLARSIRFFCISCVMMLQVNSFGSAAQAVVVFLLLPGLAALRGISPTELPQYLTEGTVDTSASC